VANVRKEIRAAIGDKLASSSALVTLLGSGRIFYSHPPQAKAMPCVTFLIRSDIPDIGADEQGLVDLEVQIDIWAEGDTAAQTCEEAVDILDELLTNWRLSTTNWRGKKMQRIGGSALISVPGEQRREQRPTIWALRVARKGV
jgi:hypothetical protein